MRILFLTFQFPYPAISGASIKTLSLLDYLRRDHDVHCLCSGEAHFRASNKSGPKASAAFARSNSTRAATHGASCSATLPASRSESNATAAARWPAS